MAINLPFSSSLSLKRFNAISTAIRSSSPTQMWSDRGRTHFPLLWVLAALPVLDGRGESAARRGGLQWNAHGSRNEIPELFMDKFMFPTHWDPVPVCSSYLGKFAQGSKLALFFEVMQSRPIDNFSRKLAWLSKTMFWKFCPMSPWFSKVEIWTKLRRKQNGRCESGRHILVEYQHHLGPRMDDIVGKTCQIYNSLPPCQEIAISCHRLKPKWSFCD